MYSTCWNEVHRWYLVAGKLVKNERFLRKNDFLTFPHSPAIETNYMDDLFAVWDRPCIKHASRKWAWADVIMPLRWNFQNKIFEFQGVQIEAGDANDISGRTSYVEQVPEPLSLDWWPLEICSLSSAARCNFMILRNRQMTGELCPGLPKASGLRAKS